MTDREKFELTRQALFLCCKMLRKYPPVMECFLEDPCLMNCLYEDSDDPEGYLYMEYFLRKASKELEKNDL
jgi:hypothetical protein